MKRVITGFTQAAMLCLACWGIAQAAPPADLQGVRPLLDSRGEIEHPEPGAIPPNPEQRTRAGLYATEAQARLLEDTLHDQVISEHVACCGEASVDDAVRHVWHAHVAYGTPTTMPVLVYGDDPWHSAQVVDRLTDKGFSRVFLVRAP
ncbi:MAG: hypothetical protein JSR53_01160 [Proteobacteria bacterium]|nr:hypothetical protein [Pseudomonadota bacterium]